MYIVSGLLTEALLSADLHELQVLRKAMQSSVMHVTLASQQQPSLRYCFNLLKNSFEITDGLQTLIMLLTTQYPREL
jgi:arginine repressor